MSDQFPIEEVFESAVSIVRNLPKEGSIKPSDELKLRLYGLFKQATHGPNDTPKPRFYQIVDGYKWDAWNKLGDMSKQEAMASYISELKRIMESIPQDEAEDHDAKHFEDVLGKKFYDYWFGQWKNSRTKKELATSLTDYSVDQTSSEDYSGDQTATDQFALAVLRLQQNLKETDDRIATIDIRLKGIADSVSKWENRISNPTIGLFFLGYPILVYCIMRALDRRRNSRGST